MPTSKKNKPPSPYTLLNKWLYDGSENSILPKEVIEAREIGSQYILWYFKNSIYNVYINKHFNNFEIYKLDKETVLLFLKRAIIDTGFKPQFMPRQKSTSTKIGKILKLRYPYFKKDDVNLLVSLIDDSEEKDQIYETLGLYAPKKKKTTKANQKDFKEFVESAPIQEVIHEPDDNPETIESLKTDEFPHTLSKFMSGFEIERT